MDGSTHKTLEYKPPENLAGRGVRLGAKIIDTMVAVIIFFGVNNVVRALGHGAGLEGLLGPGLGVGYLFFADALPNGQSLGKKLFGICVVDERSFLNCNIYQAFIRNLPLQFVSILDWLFIFTASRKRLGDMFASTVVIRFK